MARARIRTRAMMANGGMKPIVLLLLRGECHDAQTPVPPRYCGFYKSQHPPQPQHSLHRELHLLRLLRLFRWLGVARNNAKVFGSSDIVRRHTTRARTRVEWFGRASGRWRFGLL